MVLARLKEVIFTISEDEHGFILTKAKKNNNKEDTNNTCMSGSQPFVVIVQKFV